ncbi:hypothetical protein OAG16_00770 [Saprospiraceae bacterium]|jgi:hypothetical protein|nr:hypothetical protein [Saprospiraceae bacterium]MDG1433228.1 hypothetical protein [Saprospiraceae bacterium]
MMEVPIHIFEPITFKATLITTVFTFLSIFILGLLYYLNKKEMNYEETKRRGLYSILLGIALLLTTSTAILNFWNSFEFKTIKLYKNAIETPRGKVAFKDIQNAYIYIDKPMTITTPPADSLMSYNRLLILEEFDKTSHVMAEENYAIDDILKKIKFLVEEDRKSK